MKYNGFQWSLKVWLSSCLFAPVVLIPIMRAVGRSLATSFSIWIDGLFYLVMSLLAISLIPWIIVLSFLKRLTRSRLSRFAQKLIIYLIVTILPGSVFLVGALASPPTDWTGMYGLLGYAITSAICIFYYKLRSGKTMGSTVLGL